MNVHSMLSGTHCKGKIWEKLQVLFWIPALRSATAGVTSIGAGLIALFTREFNCFRVLDSAQEIDCIIIIPAVRANITPTAITLNDFSVK